MAENAKPTRNSAKDLVKEYLIFIAKGNSGKTGPNSFSYRLRGVITSTPGIYKGFKVNQEHYIEETIRDDGRNIIKKNTDSEKMLKISTVHHSFKSLLLNFP
jgi:hypothetical protein